MTIEINKVDNNTVAYGNDIPVAFSDMLAFHNNAHYTFSKMRCKSR